MRTEGAWESEFSGLGESEKEGEGDGGREGGTLLSKGRRGEGGGKGRKDRRSWEGLKKGESELGEVSGRSY